jgi:hypothetical protein
VVDVIGPGSCQVARFVVDDAGPFCSAAAVLIGWYSSVSIVIRPRVI